MFRKRKELIPGPPQRVATFGKVTEKQFTKDAEELNFLDGIKEAYESVVKPTRATEGSAGYDFVSPFEFTLSRGETIVIPTGIRVGIRRDHCLILIPRSGMGFKYRVQLDNTVGLIDSDYDESDNEGHIMVKLTNDSKTGKILEVHRGDKFVQGVFLPFGITVDDCVGTKRNGGMGSTGK